jgi:Ca2+-binding EF-hand superfamily protein
MNKSTLVLWLALSSLGAVAAEATITDSQLDVALKKADRGRDGAVSLSEARNFHVTRQAIDAANTDTNGTLDRKEFAAAIEFQFKAADADGNGKLDWQEAHAGGVRNKRIFNGANPLKDGTLDLPQFLAALTAQAR